MEKDRRQCPRTTGGEDAVLPVVKRNCRPGGAHHKRPKTAKEEHGSRNSFVALMDIFALNSLWEGLLLAAIEAMAMGKPIVATDVEGSRELVVANKCGRLSPPGRPDVMA
jgi:hypothetical protein